MARELRLTLAAMALIGAGPISRFDSKPPTAELATDNSLEAVERCLIDYDGSFGAVVYAQADRPDEANIIYWNGGAVPFGRAQIKRAGSGSTLRLWMPSALRPDRAEACAPR